MIDIIKVVQLLYLPFENIYNSLIFLSSDLNVNNVLDNNMDDNLD